MMIFLLIISSIIGLTTAIPQNLEIDVVRIKLYRQGENYPPLFNGLKILESMMNQDMLSYQVEHVYLPVFEESQHKELKNETSKRVLEEIQSGWTKNSKEKLFLLGTLVNSVKNISVYFRNRTRRESKRLQE